MIAEFFMSDNENYRKNYDLLGIKKKKIKSYYYIINIFLALNSTFLENLIVNFGNKNGILRKCFILRKIQFFKIFGHSFY